MFKPPSICHICQGELQPHPLYQESGTQYCSEDGDFFVQQLRGEEPTVIFRPFDEAPIIRPIKKKFPVAEREKSPEEKSRRNPPLAGRVEWELEPAEYLERIRAQLTEKPRVGRPGIVIQCDQTGDMFSSIRELAHKMNLDRHSIFKQLRGTQQSVGGYTFTKVGYSYERPKPRKPPILRLNNHALGQAIRCDQTRKIFPSIRDAATTMSLNRDSISRHIRGGQKDVSGYTFTKLNPKENPGRDG